MKTDDLIAMLSTDVDHVNHREPVRMIGGAVVIGVVLAVTTVVVFLGRRPDLVIPGAWLFLTLKLLFGIGVLVPASVFLIKLARPGGEHKTRFSLLIIPFAIIISFAVISLAFTPSSHWREVVIGNQWVECLLSIPIIAIAPFAMIVLVVRQTAPTDLTLAGALTGVVAGTVSAIGYALHCTDDTLPFIAAWYGGTIALCAITGAILGPRLLRW